MTPRRRTVLLLVTALVLTLLVCAPALAAAGGGSGGFGGGGGGGGGRGVGLYILFQLLIRLAILGHGLGALVIIGLIVAYLIIANGVPQARGFWSAQQRSGRAERRRVAQRAHRVEAAAAEAAEDDPAFAADQVKPAAAQLFADIQTAWSRGDRRTLSTLVAPELYREWERRLDDFARRGWHNQVELLAAPRVEYVGLRHGDEDRVVVRIEARLRDYVVDHYGGRIKRAGRFTETVRTREYWVLGRHQGHWRLVSIEQGGEGVHALEEQIVATPWSDEQALRDEALVEQAAADTVPEGTGIAEVADLHFEGSAHAAALDLSLVDGRFAPDVLAVSVRRAVQAWAEAVDGESTSLGKLAAPQAVRDLLHPGDAGGRTRLVVRGPRVEDLRIMSFEPQATPPRMAVEIKLNGRRYLEDRDTTDVVAGNPARATTWVERWTFALSEDDAQPWRIVAADAPAPAGRRQLGH